MTKKYNLYLGKAGHLAMMAEFLVRGWNVAIPEVDIGDDIFVVQDENGTLRRVQVKTASAKPTKSGFSAKYQLPKRQLLELAIPIVHYVFMTRIGEKWSSPIILRQDTLKERVEKENVGTIFKNQVTVYFSHVNQGVRCSKHDFSRFISDFTDFPIIIH
jgi:hypothetical protein